MSAHSPNDCPFNRADTEVSCEPIEGRYNSRGGNDYLPVHRCRICKVTFEEWMVLQIRQIREAQK